MFQPGRTPGQPKKIITRGINRTLFNVQSLFLIFYLAFISFNESSNRIGTSAKNHTPCGVFDDNNQFIYIHIASEQGTVAWANNVVHACTSDRSIHAKNRNNRQAGRRPGWVPVLCQTRAHFLPERRLALKSDSRRP